MQARMMRRTTARSDRSLVTRSDIEFDDGGSKYDATGALKNWWTEDDLRQFNKRTACVVDEFNSLEVTGGLHHNGKQVLGEALGDLGGLTIAFRAYKRSSIPAKSLL